MSSDRPPEQSRGKKREVIQRPFRQGVQWVTKQFDELRTKPASPRSTRPPSIPTADTSQSSANPALRANAAQDHASPSSPPLQDIPRLTSSLAQGVNSSVVADNETRRATSPRDGSNEEDEHPHSFSTPSPPQGSMDQAIPQVVHYGPVYNIGTAGNVNTGPTFGSVTMISDRDEIMAKLFERLKVCIKADYMYYGNSGETSLRRRTCTPGTRVSILLAIMRWALDMSSGAEIVFWLSGQAGAGKTTISYTVAHQLETLVVDGSSRVILGATFFCSRQFLDTRSACSIIRTIAYQLALKSEPFRMALKEHGRFETVNHGPRSQLMGLLVEPWKMSAPGRHAANEPCYVIPIDAMEELEGTGGVEFLSTLFEVADQQDLPGLKFFLTSRPEPSLVKRIESFSSKRVCRLEKVPIEESNADIKLYLKANLAECATTEQIDLLVSDAAGLFIYAATVVEYVTGRNLGEQRSLLGRLLSPSPSSSTRRPSRAATTALNNLYLQILETSLVDPRDLDDGEAFQDCLSILHTFLCTIQRTSTSVAVAILNAGRGDGEPLLDDGMANGVLDRLYAVLYNHDGHVLWFHKSFPDFLFDKNRSGRFFCDQDQHHRRLTSGCFKTMKDELRFNIANIPSSHQLDCDNPNLVACTNANILEPLRYACGNYTAHLILTSHKTPNLLPNMLGDFLELHILFWMEVMNLLGQRGQCQGMLRKAQQWSQKSEILAGLVGSLADAAAFAAYHCSSKASVSTPHLYLSSLSTFPRQSPLVQTWRRQFAGIPRFIGARAAGEAQVASIMVGEQVSALAVSPDGTNVAVGSCDVVRIWDLSTGEEVRALKGHTNFVTAVAYSPDGSHVVSGSLDSSVRVWDLSTGEHLIQRLLGVYTSHMVETVAYSADGTHVISDSWDHSIQAWDLATGEVRVLKGHTGLVVAVAYSPIGTHFISGSWDNSVRVWDLSTGEEARVLHGHTGSVTAVAYSPDGTLAVSGSEDCSVRVWDLSKGEVVRVLKGHTSSVKAVAYSPDRTHVVSVSDDKSVRVWDLLTGKEVRVLGGHTSLVNAVAYSPDGTHVVSGSCDNSVRVWDLSTRQDEVGILKGHTSSVKAVAYSPDGTHVISGSQDNSVGLWDLATGEEERVLHGHTSSVMAVAYSPDGTHAVSCSWDKSVRMWDLSTGKEVRVLEGHTHYVVAVAYSCDGTHVVSGSWDKSVRVWHLSTGADVRVLRGHSDWVSAVAYSPDGIHIVSGSRDNSVRVWDLSTGEGVRIIKGHTDSVMAVACSPNGTHLVSGSFDKSIRVWDLSTGQEVGALGSHTSPVLAVAYSPDGTYVVSGLKDNSVRVWDLSRGEDVRRFESHAGLGGFAAVAYSPDGTHVVSDSFDDSIRVWNVSPQSVHKLRYIRQKDSNDHHTGWLVSPTDPSARLMFVPITARLPDDSNVLTLPKSAMPHLDLSKAKLGDQWTECYTPSSL